MTQKTKSVLLLFVMLSIGIMAGVLLTSNYYEREILPFRNLETEEQFLDLWYDMIQPTERQKKQLQPLLKEHWNNVSFLRNTVLSNVHEHIGAFREKMVPLLQHDQLKRLDERIKSIPKPIQK